jgi:hypothetical protein
VCAVCTDDMLSRLLVVVLAILPLLSRLGEDNDKCLDRPGKIGIEGVDLDCVPNADN